MKCGEGQKAHAFSLIGPIDSEERRNALREIVGAGWLGAGWLGAGWLPPEFDDECHGRALSLRVSAFQQHGQLLIEGFSPSGVLHDRRIGLEEALRGAGGRWTMSCGGGDERQRQSESKRGRSQCGLHARLYGRVMEANDSPVGYDAEIAMELAEEYSCAIKR